MTNSKHTSAPPEIIAALPEILEVFKILTNEYRSAIPMDDELAVRALSIIWKYKL